MSRKPMTEEQKERARANLAKARAARTQKQQAVADSNAVGGTSHPQNLSGPTDPGTQNVDIGELLKRIQELERDRAWQPQNSVQATPGGMVGTYDKYKVDPKHYPDPRERLSRESRLAQFAFPENYELEWDISVSSYKTLDGINTREPKFTLELNRIMRDEKTGDVTNGRYTICRMIFHEDPDAALVVARENGLDVQDYEEEAFLNEMRYLRMRDWLVEAFYPPKPTQAKSNKKDMVIGGKMVQYFEVNSEESESIPFAQLSNKL